MPVRAAARKRAPRPANRLLPVMVALLSQQLRHTSVDGLLCFHTVCSDEYCESEAAMNTTLTDCSRHQELIPSSGLLTGPGFSTRGAALNVRRRCA